MMLRNHGSITNSLLMSLDVILSASICLFLLHWPAAGGLEHPFQQGGSAMVAIALIGCLVWPITFQQFDVYASARTLGMWEVARRLIISGFVTATILGAFAFAADVPLSRSFPFVCAAVQGVALAGMRFFSYGVLRTARRFGRNTRNVLIVGSGSRAAQIKRNIDAHPSWGLRVLGFVDDVDSAVDPSLFAAKLFKIDQMSVLLGDMVVDRVVVACPRSMLGSIAPVLKACSGAGVPLTLLPDLFGDFLPTPQIGRFGSRPSLEFAAVHHNSFLLGVKRLIDIIGASVGLVLVAPIVAVAALAIWLEDRQPIFFRQTRSGLYGRPFMMVKLRTMGIDAEAQKAALHALNEMDGPVFKVRFDPRITKVGAFLRRYSLDEIPQFWNVLMGDMSLVGPRPPVPEEVSHYEISERRRLSMRPGITCIWQVSGRNEIGFNQWVKLDLQYIDSWSLMLDLRIILQTIPAVLLARGAR
jgi:exopolysaccharide biosynthesis polyprenyl glycosylphosphotransferase